MWNYGLEFFSQFQAQYIIANNDPTLSGNINDTYKLPRDAPVDIKKMFNIIKLTGNKYGQAYTKAQFFCAAARPCSCCNDDSYVAYFWPECRSASKCRNPDYLKLCKRT
jgi:hypothetical protein